MRSNPNTGDDFAISGMEREIQSQGARIAELTRQRDGLIDALERVARALDMGGGPRGLIALALQDSKDLINEVYTDQEKKEAAQ